MLKTKCLYIFSAGLIRLYHLWDNLVFASPLVKKRQAITQTIREQFEQQVDFLQRLVQAKSANPFTPETSLPSLPVEEAVASLVQ